MKQFFYLAILGGILLQFSCKTTLPVRPSEQYDEFDIKPRPSVINVPIKIYKNELQQAINQEVGEILFEDADLEDGLSIKASKGGDIVLDLNNQEISYRVPLNLWIKKSLFLGDAEAEGSLAIDFKTSYEILPDWTFVTQTVIEDHEWLQKPVLKLGFANLPIKFIADIVLDKMRSTLTTAIDQNIKNAFDLKEQMDTAWISLQNPIFLSEEYQAWFLFNPEKIEMTELSGEENKVEGTVVITSYPKIIMGEKPEMKFRRPLPEFKIIDGVGDDFLFEMETSISYSEAERISKEKMIGETYSAGKRSVTVRDLELFGKGNKLVVNTLLEGDYNGHLYFIGEPKYNARKNKIEMEKVDFDFSSKRFLLKSASWLFKGPLKKAIQDNLDFYLDENLEEVKKMIQEQLDSFEFSKGTFINGNLEELNISHVFVAPDGIHVRVGLTGKLNVDVKGF